MRAKLSSFPTKMAKRKRETGEQGRADASQAKRKRVARKLPPTAAAKVKREREAGEQPKISAEENLELEVRMHPNTASADVEQNLEANEHPETSYAAASAAANRRREAAKRITQMFVIHQKRIGGKLRKNRPKKTEDVTGYGRRILDPDDWIDFPSFERGNEAETSLRKHQTEDVTGYGRHILDPDDWIDFPSFERGNEAETSLRKHQQPAGLFLSQPTGICLKDLAAGKKQPGTAEQLGTTKKTPSRMQLGAKLSQKQTESSKKSANETFLPITKKVKLNVATKIDPPVGLKKSISRFAEQFEGGNPIVLKQIKQLSEKYVAIRQIRADGNCYFRSFAFSYLENLILNQDYTEAARFTARIEEVKLTLAEFITSDVVEHHHRALCTLLKDVFPGLDPLSSNNEQNKSGHSMYFSHEILTRMSPETSDHVVSYLRLITSAEIRRRVGFFKPFVLHSSVEEFCKDMVEPMGKECTFVQMTALSDALGIPVRVVFNDQTAKFIDGVFYHDFIPSQMAKNNGDPDSGTVKPLVTLLALPGHFHILYCK